VACPGLCSYPSPATTDLQSQRTVVWRAHAGSSRKLPQKGCCQERQGGVVHVVHALHPRMDSSSPGHACSGTHMSVQVSTSTHSTFFPGLGESRRVMGLAAGCGVQEQGRAGGDTTLQGCQTPGCKPGDRRSRRHLLLAEEGDFSARGCSGGRGSRSGQETGW